MELIYGTGNPAKLAAMRQRLSGLPVTVTGLGELGVTLPKVAEDGKTPLENARKKALAYYHFLKRPVFSCDSGLYLEGVPQELQPGVHVRTVGGDRLTDEEMIAYYGGLAAAYGKGRLTARYYNAICLVADKEHIYEQMDDSLASEPFWLVDTPHPNRNPGFPLDSISIDPKTGRYYYDGEDSQLDQVAVEEGFLDFFRGVISSI